MCTVPTHTDPRSKSYMNAFKIRDSNSTALRITDDEPHRSLNQSNTLPFRKLRKQADSATKIIASNHLSHPEVPSVYNLSPSVSAIAGRIGIRQPNENSIECLTGAGVTPKSSSSNASSENNAFQSMKLNQPTNIPAQIIYSTNMDKVPADSRIGFARNRPQVPNCEYDQLCVKRTGASRLQPLPLSSSATRFQNNNSQSLPKDLARYSICSAESEKTDYTDLSPMTPSTPHIKREANRSPDAQCEFRSIAQSNIYKDFTEAGCSRSSPSIQKSHGQRYLNHLEQQCDKANADQTSNVTEMHARPVYSAAPKSSHQISPPACDNVPTLRGSSDVPSGPHGRLERRNAFLRSKNSPSSAQEELERQSYKNITAGSIVWKSRGSNISSSDNSAGVISATMATTSVPRRTRANDDSNFTKKDQRKLFDSYRSALSGTVWPKRENEDERL